MNRRKQRTASLVALGLATALSLPASAEVLLVDGSLEAHVADGEWCAPTVYVEILSPDPLPFVGDQLPIRRLVGMLRDIVPSACPQATELSIVGLHGDNAVFAGTGDLASGNLVSAPEPTDAHRLPLNRRDQIRQIQTALTELGFAPGPIDGVMGSQTFRAITEYQLSRGPESDGQPSLSLLAELRALQGLPTAMTGAGGTSNPGLTVGDGQLAALPPSLSFPDAQAPEASLVGNQPDSQAQPTELDPLDVNEAFERLLIGYIDRDPSVLEDDRFIAGLIAMSDGCEALGEAARNEITLPRFIAENRQRMLDLVDEAPRTPFVLRYEESGQLGNYNLDGGHFPLDFNGSRGDFEITFRIEGEEMGDRFCLRQDAARRYAWQSFPRRFRVSFDTSEFDWIVPMSAEEAEQFIASRVSNYRARAVYIEIVVGNVRPSFATGSNSANDFRADVLIARVTDPQDDSLLREFNPQAEADDDDLSRSATPSLVAYAGERGIDIERGRLLIDGTRYSSIDSIPGSAAFIEMLELREIVEDIERGGAVIQERGYIEFGNLYYTMPERRGLIYRAIENPTREQISMLEAHDWAPAPFMTGTGLLNEFNLPRLREEFEAYLPEFVASQNVPMSEIPMLLVCTATIGEYDFAQQVFPLAPACFARLPQFGAQQTETVAYTFDDRLPLSIPVPSADAEAFASSFYRSDSSVLSASRTAPLGVELTITGFETVEGRYGQYIAPQISFDGVAMYTDLSLENEVYRWTNESWAAAQEVPSGQVAPLSALAFDRDVIALMLSADGLIQPSQDQNQAWMHWLLEIEEEGNAVWPPFLSVAQRRAIVRNDPSDIGDQSLQQFAAWNDQRAQVLPDTFDLPTFMVDADDESAQAIGEQSLLPTLFWEVSSYSLYDNERRGLAEVLRVPEDYLYSAPIRFRTRSDEFDIERVVLVLPSSLYDYSLPVVAQAMPTSGSIRGTVTVSIDGVELIPSRNGRSIAVFHVEPVEGQLVTDNGLVIAEQSFDSGGLRTAISEIEFPDFLYFFNQAVDLGGQDQLDLATSIAPSSNAFEVRDWAERLVTQADAGRFNDQSGGSVWMIGEARLEEYDFDHGGFPIRRLTFGPYSTPNATGDWPYDAFRYEIVGDLPQYVWMESDAAARAWYDANPDFPDFSVRFLVEPVGVSDDRRLTLQFRVLGMELLDEGAVLTTRDPRQVRYSLGEFGRPEPGAPSDQDMVETLSSLDGFEGAYDILGVRIGDDLGQAMTALAADLEGPRTFDLHVDTLAHQASVQGPPRDSFLDGRLILNDEMTEAIALFQEREVTGEAITAIVRTLGFAEEAGPTLDRVRSALLERYGAPEVEITSTTSALFGWNRGGPSRSGSPESASDPMAVRNCRDQAANQFQELTEVANILAEAPSRVYSQPAGETWSGDSGGYSWSQNSVGPINSDLLRMLTTGHPCGDVLVVLVSLSDTGSVTNVVTATYSSEIYAAIRASRSRGTNDVAAETANAKDGEPEAEAEPEIQF